MEKDEKETRLEKTITARARWKALTDRLAEEMGKGYTLSRIVIEIGDISTVSVERLRAWSASSNALRGESRYVGELCIAEKIEDKLSAWFKELDTERASAKNAVVQFVETSVSRKVFCGLERARELCKMSEISAPPGAGKTSSVEQYLAQCRKLESFNCPVWKVTLSEHALSLNSVLQLIAREIDPESANIEARRDYSPVSLIEEKTEGRGGLLIVDEAQHIGDAKQINGIKILNGLRYFVDNKYFGIAFMSNGEIYRRVKARKYDQISSRMEAWRVAIKGVSDEDVDLILAAWGVSGKLERKWCLDKAKGSDGLRTITDSFMLAKRELGEINYQTLTMLERI